MKKNQFLNKKLTCIKTGYKAKIINYYELNEVSYVKVDIMMQFKIVIFTFLKHVALTKFKASLITLKYF